MPEGMPERTPECLPDRMPEDLPDRMPEDLPVTKCINVMVGITRSKVIYCSFFTCKCPSRHNSMHFFDMATSKSGPKLRCFVHFDLEMCFAPQRRALFRHLNFQKWSEPLVFLTFWLRKVLCATTACTFSTSQLPKVVRTWDAFSFFTCKCASRHNGVQFFISHLASWLRTRRFSEPTFRPSGATHHWKTECFATFLPFRAPGSSFFSDFLFFDLLSSCLLFSDSSHLCFSFVHIVGSLTSKLPSIIIYYIYTYDGGMRGYDLGHNWQ